MRQSLALSFLLVASPLVAGQAAGPAAQQKVRPAASASRHALPVDGLTAENEAAVKTALESMAVVAHVCPKCSMAFPEAGECEGCSVALERRRMPLLAKVGTDPATGSVTFQPAGVAPVSLSALTRAIDATGASVDPSKLKLAAPLVLVFAGGTNARDAQAVSTALTGAAELYAQAHATYSEEDHQIRVRVTGGRAPEQAAIIKAVSEAVPTVILADVLWGQPANGKARGQVGAGEGKKAGKKKGKGKQGKE